MAANHRKPVVPAALRDRIAGRYVVEAELGEGGMGVVSRVRDESTGRTVALKQLRPGAGRAVAALFRREYHTLVLLKHPRIIDVYDYGIDRGVPYYTMELLDGDDLRLLAPLEYREACRHLRDVASSLALLAAHRLIHRDLTARNVRVTSDGRSKLIDFGALSPFGVTDALVGTAPYMPPEAVRGLPLDQHADLFALGALSYYLLTGTHAFPARDVAALEAAWKTRPERPSMRVARLIERGALLTPLPKALDDLVLSLLCLEPAARPQSAAEAIERFGAAAGLESDVGALAPESYLLSAELVGRALESERAKASIASAIAGRGKVLSIRHGPGAGGTRLLTEIALEARLSGAIVLHVDSEQHRGPLAVARVLADKLKAALPDDVVPVPAELDAIGAGPASRMEPSSRPALDPTSAPLAARLRVQSALERWFVTAARTSPLAILVDNAQGLDEASATLLSLLAGVAKDNPLFVAVTFRSGEPALAHAPLRFLERAGDVVELVPLSSADVLAFVESSFGNVPNNDRLAYWLHGLSGGNPHELTELSQYLVRRGIARYVDGTWVLPRELPADLPSRVEEAQDRRLAELGPKAVNLASALAVCRGRLSLELCVALAEAERADAFVALDELISAGILAGYEHGYRFAQKSTRERLLARLTAREQQRLHLLIGEHLLGAPELDLTTTLDAGWHLLSGGDERKGAEILRRVALELVQADELPEAIPALEAAVAVYRRLDRPRNELSGLLHPLAFAGYYVERHLADRYADEALRLLAEETGAAVASRLRPYLGRHLSLVAGLGHALILHQFGGRGGVRGLSAQISILGGLITALVGGSIICLDSATARRRAGVFEPFEPLGLWHAGAFCYAMTKTVIGMAEDRVPETIEKLRELLARLDRPWGVIGFPERMKPITRGGLLYALGVVESFMDEPVALDRADELESCGLRLYDMVACQIRANYYACQGNSELAREYHRRVEIHAMRNGSTWQAEVWAPTSNLFACKRTRDLMGFKRATEELERLSQEIPSLRLYAATARAMLAAFRGEYEAAVPLFEGLLAEIAPRAFIGWEVFVAGLAEAYNETGQHARAEALCRRIIEGLSREDRMVVSLSLDIELQCAVAEARCGRIDDARRRLDELIRLHEPNRGAVTLGSIHRTHADVAFLAGDTEAARQHRLRMSAWFRSTNNPSLIAECERVDSAGEPANPSDPPARRGEEATIRERSSGTRPSTEVTGGPATEVKEGPAVQTADPEPNDTSGVAGRTRSTNGH